jgi:signal transduction histidine kinase
MALPLMVGEEIIGALTVQSVEEAAFSKDDITALQAMADQLAIAINNARLLHDLEVAHANLLRTKTFEAIATATTEAIHWIGNKTMPIPISVARLREDLDRLPQADPALIESIHEDLELIENSARLILAVKEHLIGPAREHEPRPAMLDDVVKDTAVALKIPLEIIRYEVTPDLPLGWVDTTQLSRACGYILKNAMEAVEGMVRPSILVELSPAPDARFVSMRITDTGLGIPTEDLDKIWAAFYTTKGGVQHTGLGLSATWQIIREMGGHAFAANSPRGGASFELLIPAFEGDLPAAPLPTGKSFLLVDDDDPWSRFATETLTASGNTVIRSADGRADPTTFDLILLDDVLEAGSGEAMLKWLKTLDASSKTLVIASSLRVERFMQLMRFGARDVMLKPYTPAALAQIVK